MKYQKKKAAELQTQLLQKIKTICEQENLIIQASYGKYILTSVDNDKISLGDGAFVNVYYKKSQQIVVKELKRELLSDHLLNFALKESLK